VINKKKNRRKKITLRTQCAAAASVTARVRMINHSHAAVASQLNAV